jgi:predicted outer membrane protein
MSKLTVFAKFSMAVFVAASFVSVAAAQEPTKRQETKPSQVRKERVEQRRSEQKTSATDENVSRMLATCVAISNQHELAMCRFSLEHIENAKVKQFAEMMIAEHTKCAEKLAQFAPESASEKLDASGKNRPGTSTTERKIQQTSGNKDDAKPERDAAKPADLKQNDVRNAAVRKTATAKHNGGANEDRLVSIERQVAEECLSLASKELTEAKEAGNFDEAFLRCQVGAHLGMLAKLNVYEGAVDGELSQIFKEGQTTTEKHLTEAKKLIAEVGKK